MAKQKAVNMTHLTSKLELFAQSRGLQKLSESTKKHMRRKIEGEFGSSLDIFPNSNGKLLVLPCNLSLRETVKEKIAL